MNWLALLGILVGAYGIFALYVAWKKPDKIWNMGKVQSFTQKLGERGTQIWFTVFGVALLALGLWLMLK